jgi:prepilin-type N-terminal cleavage/methylation domain-containing protein
VRRRRREGFTLIEVMVSLGIMTMGAMAILALLAQIIRTNGYARQMNTAMNVGQEWVDRLKQDAHSWVQQAAIAGSPTPAEVLVNTLYLRNVTTLPTATFRVLPAGTAVISAAFDYQGNDVALPVTGGAAFFYCAAYRANWIYFGKSMRVDVRVFWPRAGTAASNMDDYPNCFGNQGLRDVAGSYYH